MSDKLEIMFDGGQMAIILCDSCLMLFCEYQLYFKLLIVKNKIFLFSLHVLFFLSSIFFSRIFYSILTFTLILSFIIQLPIYDKKDDDFVIEYDKKSELPLIKEISSIRLQVSGIVSYLSVSKYSNIICYSDIFCFFVFTINTFCK